jgi:hypothetical protein
MATVLPAALSFGSALLVVAAKGLAGRRPAAARIDAGPGGEIHEESESRNEED